MKISPSILGCNFNILGQEVAAIQGAGADMLHLDIMDGHFVPNISFGLPIIASLRKEFDMIFDTHLMISNPLDYIDAFAKAGSDIITFHQESESDVQKTIDKIHSLGKKAGLSLKPATKAEKIIPYLDKIETVLVMCVEPGFGGQSFNHDQMEKLSILKQYKDKHKLTFELQVDGGIDPSTAKIAAKNGAENLVVGSWLFSRPDYAEGIRLLRG